MKIYNSSMNIATIKEYSRRFPNKKLNVLRSFGMLDGEVFDICTKHRELIGGLILDSGTWTLNNASPETTKHITLENYAGYLKRFGSQFDFYFNFDSNFTNDGFEENYANQLILEKRGLKPVPVVHDINGSEIPTYIDRGYERVALGSTQIKSVRTMAKVMEQFEGTGIKVHLFGNTKFELLANFPIDSCDSAMWAKEGGYGQLRFWNPKKEGENKTDQIYTEDYLREEISKEKLFSSYPFREDLKAFLYTTFGITHYDLLGRDGAYHKRLVNTYYFVQLEEIITRIHKEKGFPVNL